MNEKREGEAPANGLLNTAAIVVDKHQAQSKDPDALWVSFLTSRYRDDREIERIAIPGYN